MNEAEKISLAYCVGQLRHAYHNLIDGVVKDQKQFADGLIAPQIRFFETLLDKYTTVPQTHEKERSREVEISVAAPFGRAKFKGGGS